MLLARSINPSAPTLFHAPLSPYARSHKPAVINGKRTNATSTNSIAPLFREYAMAPVKLIWTLTPPIRVGIRFAETRLSDLICQNDCQALEFKGYGKNFITSHGFSPDAFVQMAFQAAYFGLYGVFHYSMSRKSNRTHHFEGRTECTYEPAMTKAFLHGRTEAIRTVQPESVDFTKVCTHWTGLQCGPLTINLYLMAGLSRLLDVLFRGAQRREGQCITQSM